MVIMLQKVEFDIQVTNLSVLHNFDNIILTV